jgi:hypothetical protein
MDGFTYPIMMIGRQHTYGMLGLSYMFMTIGLLAVG